MTQHFVMPSRNEEGVIFNKFLYSRLIRRNRNILCCITGPTGSGKTYQDLRRAELWYKYYFKKDFPIRNICFSVHKVIKLLPHLKRGEIIIFEEAGVGMGALDFQNRISKMFTYVLQSFRSMNIAIFFNLPYLSMLNKQARMLIHFNFQTYSIDTKHKVAISKGYIRQVNQQSGKVYVKFLRVHSNNGLAPIKKFIYGLPSERLRNAYEIKKRQFLEDTLDDYDYELDKIKGKRRVGTKPLTKRQQEIYDLRIQRLTQAKISEKLGISQSAVSEAIKAIEKKGYTFTKEEKKQ